MKLKIAIETYLDDCAARLSEGSVRTYRLVAMRLSRLWWGPRGFLEKETNSALRKKQLSEMWNHILKERHPPANTIGTYRKFVSAMSQFLVSIGELEANYSRDVSPLRMKYKPRVVDPRQPFTESEYRMLRRSAVGEWEWLDGPIQLGWESGMRLGDIANMKAEDVDQKTGSITIVPSKTAHVRITLVIPLSDQIMERVRAVGEGPVFPELHKYYNNGGRPDIRFRKFARACGIKKKTFHCLRHSFVSRMVASGATIQMIKSITGQSTKIIELYSKPDLESKRKAIGI